MGAATTFRAEVPGDGRALNQRQALTFSGGAGSTPQNPLQAGLGVTFVVTAAGATAFASVTGRVIYMAGAGEQPGPTFQFIAVPSELRQYAYEGALGGPRLGFPTGLDYDIPKPFELEVSVLYRGGARIFRFAFWVGNGEHARVEECATREGFGAFFKNCCFNGQGFRAAGNQQLYPYGEFDALFEPPDSPWGFGLGAAANVIDLACNIDALENPYLPDSITGESDGLVDNPFVNPSAPLVVQSSPYDLLAPVERITVGDDNYSAAELGVNAGRALPPRDAANVAFATPPGLDRLSPARHPAPLRSASRRTGRVRGYLVARWIGTPLQYEASLAAAPALQLTLTGMDSGEIVYIFASTVRPEFTGITPPTVAAPLGVTPNWPVAAISEPRLVAGTGGPGSIAQLLMDIGIVTGGSASTFLAPRALTGGATWATASIGGYALVGPSGQTTFTIPIDPTYLGGALTLHALNASLPDAVMPVYIQGVVIRPGTAPSPTSGGTGLGNFAVDWPASAWLTTVAVVRLRA